MKELNKAVAEMDRTFRRVDPVKALRTWRQGATKAALGSIVEKSRKGAGK